MRNSAVIFDFSILNMDIINYMTMIDDFMNAVKIGTHESGHVHAQITGMASCMTVNKQYSHEWFQPAYDWIDNLNENDYHTIINENCLFAMNPMLSVISTTRNRNYVINFPEFASFFKMQMRTDTIIGAGIIAYHVINLVPDDMMNNFDDNEFNALIITFIHNICNDMPLEYCDGAIKSMII